ncbi:hypothetical protein [uncultured Ferrimonas sp.]|nr:hypothetical protein [uncultured Ferrimonas sp.]
MTTSSFSFALQLIIGIAVIAYLLIPKKASTSVHAKRNSGTKRKRSKKRH